MITIKHDYVEVSIELFGIQVFRFYMSWHEIEVTVNDSQQWPLLFLNITNCAGVGGVFFTSRITTTHELEWQYS